jgi:hypothetical protein
MSYYAGDNASASKAGLKTSVLGNFRKKKPIVGGGLPEDTPEDPPAMLKHQSEDEVVVWKDNSYKVQSRKGHIKTGTVLALRSRSTKSLSSGFRKQVWKEVWLVLRKGSLELFKTPAENPLESHRYIGLEEIEYIGRRYVKSHCSNKPEPLLCGFEVIHIDGRYRERKRERTGEGGKEGSSSGC